MAEDFNQELSLLEEYNQWVATRVASAQDRSPDEFMRDRVKQVAFDRLEEAEDYIAALDGSQYSNEIADIRAILKGTYIYPDEREIEGEIIDTEE